MARKSNDYFELIKKQTACCVEASDLLQEILASFNSQDIDSYRAKMHEIEHKGDELYHDILNKLATEFITPIDQEDILRLVQIIDDITDAIDEVIMDIYMYHIHVIPPKTAELSQIVNKCVKSLDEAATELKNFKKREPLHTLLVNVRSIETEADGIFVSAIHELFGSDADGKYLLGAKAVYEGLEDCCDLCGHATDIIEQVIIKNT